VRPTQSLVLGLLVAVFLLPAPADAALSRAERRAALDEIERLEVELLKADNDIRSATVTVREMESELTELESRMATAADRLEERKGRMALRLRVMYRLRHRGFLPLLFSAETPHEFLRVARYLWWIIRADDESLGAWRSELDVHRSIQHRVAKERRVMLQRAGLVSLKRDEARRLRDERQGLVGKLHRSDRRYLKTLLVQRRDKRLDVSLDLRREAPPPELRIEQAERTNPLFERSKGRLPMPAVGSVRTSGRGIDILAPEGRPIRAVADGQVLKILHISGFGLVCIIDHGSGWSTVYGHASGYAVRVGQTVRSGEEIGTVGQTGSLEGPRLHFQIRKNQDPQKPLKWLMIPPGIDVRGR
jgi:septal ring factor EnvC (AmiA/AmiB activator)